MRQFRLLTGISWLQVLIDFRKIDVSRLAFHGIPHGLVGATRLAFYAEHYQVRAVHHGPVAHLERRFEMLPGRAGADLDLVVIRPKVLLVITKFRRGIGQDSDEGAVVAAYLPFAPFDRREHQLVELSVPANKKFHIFLIPEQAPDDPLQLPFRGKGIVDMPVPKEADGITVKHEQEGPPNRWKRMKHGDGTQANYITKGEFSQLYSLNNYNYSRQNTSIE